MPGPNRKMTAHRLKNLKGTTLRILSYLKPFKWRMILVVVLIALAAACNIAGTYILSPLLSGLPATSADVGTKFTGIEFLDNLAIPTSHGWRNCGGVPCQHRVRVG